MRAVVVTALGGTGVPEAPLGYIRNIQPLLDLGRRRDDYLRFLGQHGFGNPEVVVRCVPHVELACPG